MHKKVKSILYNANYFLKETLTAIRQGLLTNIFSILSIGLIFFILAGITLGWWFSNGLIEVVREEAEIHVYYEEGITASEVAAIEQEIMNVGGVKKVSLVDKAEAYSRMEEIFGTEADVLEYFTDNPFSAFIEVNVELEHTDRIMEQLAAISKVEHIRDNQGILNQLQQIVNFLSLVSILGIAAVSATTLIITSHIIKLGIYARREQISTLRLLGATEGFIAFPFFLEGILLTALGGVLTIVLITLTVDVVYTQIANALTFIPLPSQKGLIASLGWLIGAVSVASGLVGSLVGYTTANK